MTVQLTGLGGFYTRLGKMGDEINDLQTLAATSLPTDTQNIIAQYPDNNDAAMINNISSQTQSAQSTIMSSQCGFLQTCAQNTLNTMIYQDNPLYSNTNVNVSMTELIRQMKVDSQTIQSCQVSISSTANGSNNGNGVIVTSVYRDDGLVQENSFSENIRVQCTTDNVTNPGSEGSENFTATGEVAYPVFDYRYPAGSGGSVSFNAYDAQNYNNSGQMLTNGDWATFVANAPNNWTITVGSAGTQVLQNNSIVYIGSNSLEFVGDGTTLTALTQQFALKAGTPAILTEETQYSINFFAKVNSAPGAGVLEVALVNSAGTILVDASNNPCSFTVNLTTATTSFTAYNGSVRTPYVLPSEIFIRTRLSTALSSGHNVYISALAMGLSNQIYQGGPSLAIFSGNEGFLVGDFFTSVVTNGREGNYQLLTNRVFNMNQLGLLIPSGTSGYTIPNY